MRRWSAEFLRSHAPIEPGPAEMLSAVNLSLGERRIDGQFVSIIYAVWDDERRTLQVANSGLPRPIYCHDGKIEIIEATGLPLGLFDEAEYDEFTFKAKPGDLFVFYSDGILDARNRDGRSFGQRDAWKRSSSAARPSPRIAWSATSSRRSPNMPRAWIRLTTRPWSPSELRTRKRGGAGQTQVTRRGEN